MNGKFIKQSHVDSNWVFIMMYAMIAFIVIATYVRFQKHLALCVFLLVAFALISYYSTKLLNGFGLYIEANNIYFKRIKKQQVDCANIAGIIILKSQISNKYGRWDLKRLTGEKYYTSVYVKKMHKNMSNYKNGDLQFFHDFKEEILFHTVYDEGVVNYFKSINSDIDVLKFE